MDDLQFDLGDEWFSLMLNDLNTSVFGDDAVSKAENVNNNGAATKFYNRYRPTAKEFSTLRNIMTVWTFVPKYN